MNSASKQIELTDTTVLITVRIDSPERKGNLSALLKVLARDYRIPVYVLEADETQLFHPEKDNRGIKYCYIKDDDPVFHRTKYFRQMQQEIQTPYFAIWDTDAIAEPHQVFEAILALRNNEAVMSFPYDGRFMAVDPVTSVLFRNTLRLEALTSFAASMNLVFGYHSYGGVCFLNREKYLENGGENVDFYGWGPEDIERPVRMAVFGLPVYRANGLLYHLYHPKMSNTYYSSVDAERRSRKVFIELYRKEIIH